MERHAKMRDVSVLSFKPLTVKRNGARHCVMLE